MLCFCCDFYKQNDTTESRKKHSAIYSEHHKTPDLNFFCADFDKKRIIYQNNCNYTVTYVYKITDTQKKKIKLILWICFSLKISKIREVPKVSLPILYKTSLNQWRLLVAQTLGSEIKFNPLNLLPEEKSGSALGKDKQMTSLQKYSQIFKNQGT